MTAKELITILKRFPKNAEISINNKMPPQFNASVNNDNQWVIDLSEPAPDAPEEKNSSAKI